MASDAGRVRQLEDHPDLVRIQRGRRLGWFRPASQRNADPGPWNAWAAAPDSSSDPPLPHPSGRAAVIGNATNYNINAVASPTLSRT
jgi:hypothetical protein